MTWKFSHDPGAKFVAHAVQESVNPDRVELIMHQSKDLDSGILRLSKPSLVVNLMGRLYGEAILTALAVHLL